MTSCFDLLQAWAIKTGAAGTFIRARVHTYTHFDLLQASAIKTGAAVTFIRARVQTYTHCRLLPKPECKEIGFR